MSRTRKLLGRTELNANTSFPPSPRKNFSLREVIGGHPNAYAAMMSEKTEQAYLHQASASSVSGLVDTHSLEDELLKHGYKALSKVIVVTSAGESEVKYIKAENQLGEAMYISVDVSDVYVSQSASDYRFKEADVALNISSEEKELAFEQAGMSVSGVVFECKSGLCALHRDEHHHSPREYSYVLINHRRVEETVVVASFPLVKMTDLRHNPKACHQNIDLCLRKMRNAALNRCSCQIEEVQKKLKHVCQLFDETLECKKKVIEEFKRSMDILECAYQKCISVSCPDKNSHKIKEIVYNIEKRNEKFPYLMECCQNICETDHHLDEMIEKLHYAKCQLEKKFKKLHCVYELKRHHHKKCLWEKSEHEDTSSSDEE